MGAYRAESAAVWPRRNWRAAGETLLRLARAERERWPLWLPVLMGAGIGAYFWPASEPALWLGPVLLALAAPAAFLAWRWDRRAGRGGGLLRPGAGLLRRRAAGALGRFPGAGASRHRRARGPRPGG